MASHSLANAQKQLEQYRRRDGVDYRRPVVFRVDLAPEPEPTVKAYGTLLTESVRAELAAVARVYLLFLAHDTSGNGVIDIAEGRELLTSKSSPWRIYGRRRHRQTIAQGMGIFWDRHTADRLWLRSPARIARALGCGRLRGNPINLPIAALLGGIGDVRAHFYASFESGRRTDGPISREALEQATGIKARTQRNYDQRLERQARRNIAITGLAPTDENYQRIASNGRLPFTFTDWTGKFTGQRYAKRLAYRIPDTRERIHEAAARGRLRKVNREISVVITKGRRTDSPVAYHSTAEAAGDGYNRDTTTEHYWRVGGGIQPDANRPPKMRGVGVYEVLAQW